MDDQVSGLLSLLKSDFCDPVNIGNPQEITVLSLAETIIGLTQSSSQIVFESLPIDDPTRRCPDISRAKQMLGWEPMIGLQVGLERTIEWMSGEIS